VPLLVPKEMILDYRQYLNKIPVPIKEKGRDYASATAAILMSIFFLIFAIKPTVVAIAELLGEIKAREDINQQLQEKINQIIAAQRNYNRFYPYFQYVDQALPTNTEIAYFVQHLEANRNLSNLELDGLNYSPIPLTETNPKKDSEAKDIPFTAEMKGDYPNIKTFLEKMAQYRRITYIDKIEMSLNKQQKEEESPLLPLTISINGKTFYFHQ